MPVALEQTTELGEVRVETGTGLIHELTHGAGQRNAHVVIHATHVRLDNPVQAWVDTTDGSVWPLTGELYANKTEVEYRIEVKRKPNVDKTRPIAELSNREKVRDLAAIAPKGELSAVDRIRPETAAKTAESAPPASTPPPPPEPATSPETATQPPADGDEHGPGWLTAAGREATEQRHAHDTPPPSTPPEPSRPPVQACAPCGIDTFPDQAAAVEHANTFAHKEHVARARKAAETRSAATFDESAGHLDRNVPPPSRRGARIEEGKPWELLNSDGTLNLASYSFTAAVGFVELAHDLVSKRVADVQGEGGDAPTFKMSQVQALATTLLDAADQVQASTRQDGRVDRQDASHTRARGAVRTALRVYPVPWGADRDTREEWSANLVAHAAALLRISLDLFRLDATGEGR